MNRAAADTTGGAGVRTAAAGADAPGGAGGLAAAESAGMDAAGGLAAAESAGMDAAGGHDEPRAGTWRRMRAGWDVWRAIAGDVPNWRLAGAGLLACATEAAGLALMATATWLLITAAGQPPITALTVAIVSVRALAIGRGTLRYAERLASHDAVLRIVTDVRARIFAALVDRPPARNADALSRIVSDVDAVQDLVVRVALPIVSAGIVAVIAVVVTATFAPAAGLVFGAGLLVTGVLVPVLAARLAREGADRLAPLRSAYAITTVDLVHGAADLAAYGATARFQAAGSAQATQLSTVERRLARRGLALETVSTVVTGLTAATVLMVAAGAGVSAVWTAVLAIATLATGELAIGLLAAARKSAELHAPLARIRELIGPAGASLQDPALSNDGTIRLVDVSVEGRLRGVDLTITPGRRIAVVGPSGAGKSTLLAVIAGAVVPDSGHVEGAGSAYSVATGLLADAHIFHATIRDNLLLAKPSASDDELRTAAGVAGLGDFVSQYPLEMVVGEDGALLSGGQRQRLALARAVLAAPRVLLLDEPTEALDPHQAATVLKSVLANAADAAVVVVTHRLEHLAELDFDEVLLMRDGRVLSDEPTH